MKNDIDKITNAHVRYSHWLSGLLICIAAIVLIVIIAIIVIEVQTFFEGLSPSNALYHANRGDQYSENGNYDLAITEYSQAIELEPNSRALYFSRGLAYHKKRDFEHASTDFTFVLTLPPNVVVEDVDVYYARGQSYEESGKHELALADFTQFISLQPSNVFGYTNRAVSLESLGQLDEAIKDIEQALELADDPSLKTAIEKELIRLKGK